MEDEEEEEEEDEAVEDDMSKILSTHIDASTSTVQKKRKNNTRDYKKLLKWKYKKCDQINIKMKIKMKM